MNNPSSLEKRREDHKHPNPKELSTAVQKFKDYLLSPSCALLKDDSLQSVLTHVILASSTPSTGTNEQLQLKVGKHLVTLSQRNNDIMKHDALLRYILSNLIRSLTHFLTSYYDQSFNLLYSLLLFSVNSNHTCESKPEVRKKTIQTIKETF